MRRIAIALVLTALGIGCASPGEIERNGYAHLNQANALEARGDYYRADKERAAAQKQFNKAHARAYNEARLGIYRY